MRLDGKKEPSARKNPYREATRKGTEERWSRPGGNSHVIRALREETGTGKKVMT